MFQPGILNLTLYELIYYHSICYLNNNLKNSFSSLLFSHTLQENYEVTLHSKQLVKYTKRMVNLQVKQLQTTPLKTARFKTVPSVMELFHVSTNGDCLNEMCYTTWNVLTPKKVECYLFLFLVRFIHYENKLLELLCHWLILSRMENPLI